MTALAVTRADPDLLYDTAKWKPAQQSEINCVKKKWIVGRDQYGAPFPWWRLSLIQVRNYSDHCCWEANPSTPMLRSGPGEQGAGKVGHNYLCTLSRK